MSSQSAVSAGFEIEETASGAALVIRLRDGHLNYDVSDDLKSRLKTDVDEHLSEGHRSFVLDMTDVELIDSCGVGTVIAVHHQVAAAGGMLAVANTCPFVLKVLRMMRLDKFLSLFPDVERALKVVVEAP